MALPDPPKTGKENLADGILNVTILGLVAAGIVCVTGPMICCIAPVLLPILWAGYVYQKQHEKKMNKPRSPPEQMV
jgi:hypothetical protein